MVRRAEGLTPLGSPFLLGGGHFFGAGGVFSSKLAAVVPPAGTSKVNLVSVLNSGGTRALRNGLPPPLDGTSSPPSYAVMLTLCLPTRAPAVFPVISCRVNSPLALVVAVEPGPGFFSPESG